MGLEDQFDSLGTLDEPSGEDTTTPLKQKDYPGNLELAVDVRGPYRHGEQIPWIDIKGYKFWQIPWELQFVEQKAPNRWDVLGLTNDIVDLDTKLVLGYVNKGLFRDRIPVPPPQHIDRN